MAENAPYEQEGELEDGLSEEVLSLLLLAVVEASESIKIRALSQSDFDDTQSNFRKGASRAMPEMTRVSQQAIDVGLARTMTQTRLNDLSVDQSDERIQRHIRSVLASNLDQVAFTNSRAYQRILELADEFGWSDQEIARRLKRYFGLIPSHITTVVNMERALLAEGVSRRAAQSQVQSKIDQLIEWRLRLIADTIATDIVEGSKSVAFAVLYEDAAISDDFVKQWVSVIDDRTSDICLESNKTIAELNGAFPNGFEYPPAHGHCRSSIRIIRRP